MVPLVLPVRYFDGQTSLNKFLGPLDTVGILVGLGLKQSCCFPFTVCLKIETEMKKIFPLNYVIRIFFSCKVKVVETSFHSIFKHLHKLMVFNLDLMCTQELY